MDEPQRAFLDELLGTPAPSGFETAVQRVWVDYVESFADEVRTDAYGNAVATVAGDDTEVVLTGHGDEIGLMVRDVTDDGFLKLASIGAPDKSVTRGQHVTVHTDDGPVSGVVGQVAIHIRDDEDDSVSDINEMHVDVGAEDGEAARELVDVGDPITVSSTVENLQGSRIAGRALDNRTGLWAAAEGLRRAADGGVDSTVYAVATVQEEVGHQGAKMVASDLDPDAVLVADVTHATDSPEAPADKGSGIELGEGPVVTRGPVNHPTLVEAVRETAAAADIDVQLLAEGYLTFTDADDFYVAKRGVPTVRLGLPNRYMHTPVEVVDTTDLDELAELMAAFAVGAHEDAPFRVDV